MIRPTPLSESNAELMAAVAEVINASKKDLPTKVGVLLDSAAALLATSPRTRTPSDLRAIAEEMRKRMIKVVRAHQEVRDARQKNATETVADATETGGGTVLPFRPDPEKA